MAMRDFSGRDYYIYFIWTAQDLFCSSSLNTFNELSVVASEYF